MAVIKAVSSKAGIGHAIDYVTKKEKTEEKLVSGLHCEPETVKEEMQAKPYFAILPSGYWHSVVLLCISAVMR